MVANECIWGEKSGCDNGVSYQHFQCEITFLISRTIKSKSSILRIGATVKLAYKLKKKKT